MQEQMGNISKETKMLKKEPENARDQKYCNRNGETFYGLIRRLKVLKEIISELDDISIETFKSVKQREKKRNNIQELEYPVVTTTKGITYSKWEY